LGVNAWVDWDKAVTLAKVTPFPTSLPTNNGASGPLYTMPSDGFLFLNVIPDTALAFNTVVWLVRDKGQNGTYPQAHVMRQYEWTCLSIPVRKGEKWRVSMHHTGTARNMTYYEHSGLVFVPLSRRDE